MMATWCTDNVVVGHLEDINMFSGNLDCDGIDPELSAHLLEIFWNRQQHSGQVVYRPAFTRDMACGGPYFSTILLNAMYFVASKHSPRLEVRKDIHDISTAGWSFRQRVTELLAHSFDKSKITTVQALLIMASSLFPQCDERSSSWLYAGHAFNMIIDLGLHVATQDPISTNEKSIEDGEIKRRVYWSAYSKLKSLLIPSLVCIFLPPLTSVTVIDKIHCLYQGRAPHLRESESSAPRVFLDDYEELEGFSALSYTAGACATKPRSLPLYSITVLTKTSELCIIMESLLTNLYTERKTQEDHGPSRLDIEVLQRDLSSWRDSLPPPLDFKASVQGATIPAPHIISLL